MTTTDGLTDGLIGNHYVSGASTPIATSNFLFEFSTGVIPLMAGILPGPRALSGSGEFVLPVMGWLTALRVISAGNLIATGAPVPEASTTVSFGLLLALGLGGVVFAAKRKKAQSALCPLL